MHIKFYLLAVILFAVSVNVSYCQDDEDLTPEQWEYMRDDYAVKAIKLISARDSLKNVIDSLTEILTAKETELGKCEDEMYALVGTTLPEVVEFRRKFEETEKKINNRNSSPEDIRNNYFDEISASKILCLPEFSDRFISLKNKFEPGIIAEQTQYSEGTHLVVKGDCLWRISEQKLGNPVLWPVLWDINKAGVLNKSSMDAYQQTINNPNLIYPGQVLRIPALSEAQEKLETSLKSLRENWRRKQR